MITREQFEKFENVRKFGITNMFNHKVIMEYTDLNKSQCEEIVRDYKKLNDKYVNGMEE